MTRNNEQGFLPIILIIIAAFIIIAMLPKGESSNSDPQSAPAEQPQASQQPQPITENDAEKYCQDTALLGKYLDMSKVDVIDIGSYNKQYIETSDKAADGSKTMMLTWNGKVNDERTGFTCMVSGTKDNIKLHLLSVGGKDLYGSL